MNSGRRVFSWALGGVMLMALASAQAQPSAARGRPILFSDPKRDSATTNLNQVATKKMALQSVEDGLKQMNILDLADPTRHEATIPPPHVPPPNFNSRQAKGFFDKKDWAFRTQEDLEAEYNSKVDQMFKVGEYGPDGKRKKDQSGLERYYDRMEAARTATNSLAKGDSRFDDKKDGKDDRFNSKDDKKSERSSDSSTSAELKRLTGESMREAMEKDGGKPRTIADIFGINDANSPAALREQRQQELQLEKFRKILDPSFVPSTSGAGNLFGGTGPAAVPVALKPLGTLPGSPSAFGLLPSLSGGALQPQGLPELPRAPDLNTPQPKLETPPPAAQPTPAFALPKRKF